MSDLGKGQEKDKMVIRRWASRSPLCKLSRMQTTIIARDEEIESRPLPLLPIG